MDSCGVSGLPDAEFSGFSEMLSSSVRNYR